MVDVGAGVVGGPVAGFYDKVIDAHGDAAKTTLTHVDGAIDDGVGKLTQAGGDIARAAGDGINTVGHDTGQVVDGRQGTSMPPGTISNRRATTRSRQQAVR